MLSSSLRPRSNSWRSSLTFRVWVGTVCGLGSCAFPDYGVAPSAVDAGSCLDRTQDHDESDVDCGGQACAPCLTGQSCLVPKDCASGICQASRCAAPQCDDGVKNGREPAVDCGESCLPNLCPTDEPCLHNEDCQSHSCASDRCAEATCDDQQKNGAESDLDCGGSKCKKCDDGKSCDTDVDCTSGICRKQRCVQPSCDDEQLSPGETAIDCGGGNCSPCAIDSPCLAPRDCVSNSCINQRCAPPSCTDRSKNQDETDIDCGGTHCGACADGQACVGNSGCTSLVCLQQKCEAPACGDFTKNGGETGLDCGGGCTGCAAGIACNTGSDCASSVCTDSVCQAPSCEDGVKNGNESDVDCGPGCGKCAVGSSCGSNDDCASIACDGTCASPLHVSLFCNERAARVNSPSPFFKIVNTGKVPFQLSSLSLRYYYTREVTESEKYNCYTVTLGDCSLLALPPVFGDVSPKKAAADRYMELRFSNKAPTLAVGQAVEVHGAFYLPSYMQFTQTNDYSFSDSTDFASAPQVTLYANDVLIWGTEP